MFEWISRLFKGKSTPTWTSDDTNEFQTFDLQDDSDSVYIAHSGEPQPAMAPPPIPLPTAPAAGASPSLDSILTPHLVKVDDNPSEIPPPQKKFGISDKLKSVMSFWNASPFAPKYTSFHREPKPLMHEGNKEYYAKLNAVLAIKPKYKAPLTRETKSEEVKSETDSQNAGIKHIAKPKKKTHLIPVGVSKETQKNLTKLLFAVRKEAIPDDIEKPEDQKLEAPNEAIIVGEFAPPPPPLFSIPENIVTQGRAIEPEPSPSLRLQ